MSRPDTASSLRPNQSLLAETTDRLLAAEIPYGIYSGYHAALLAGHRTTRDVDIWADERRFDDLCAVFPGAEVRQQRYAKDEPMAGELESFSLALGDGTVSIMGAVVMRHQGSLHPARFEKIQDRITWVRLGATANHFVDPVDTIIGKAITQRGLDQGKHDIEDILAIHSAVDIDKPYLLRRIEDTKSWAKAVPLLQRLGILTHPDLEGV